MQTPPPPSNGEKPTPAPPVQRLIGRKAALYVPQQIRAIFNLPKFLKKFLYARAPKKSHWSDCVCNGYDSGNGIKYATESMCDCGGYYARN